MRSVCTGSGGGQWFGAWSTLFIVSSSCDFGVFTSFWFPFLLHENANVWSWPQLDNYLKNPCFYLCVWDPRIDPTQHFISWNPPSFIRQQWLYTVCPCISWHWKHQFGIFKLLARYGVSLKWMSWVYWAIFFFRGRSWLPHPPVVWFFSPYQESTFLSAGMLERKSIPSKEWN